MQPIDLLAIAAHPDDAEIGCGGTLLMAKRGGKRIGVVDLTRGELSTRGTLESRKRETEAATKLLGLDYRAQLELEDGNIELSQDNTRKLIAQLRETRPTIALLPSREERHPDHEAAAELARRAIFYAGLTKIETVGADGQPQAPHRPLLVLHYMQSHTFEPKIIVDVTPVFEERMKAIEAYHSQFANAKSNDPQTFLSQVGFFDWLRARASFYGLIIGVKYGEPFWSSEPLGTKDLFSIVTKEIA